MPHQHLHPQYPCLKTNLYLFTTGQCDNQRRLWSPKPLFHFIMLWGVAILRLAFVHSYQCGSAKNVIKGWVINLMLVAQRQNKTALIYSPPLRTWHCEVREGVCRSVISFTSCLWLMWKPHLLASWMPLSRPYLARSIHLALAEQQRDHEEQSEPPSCPLRIPLRAHADENHNHPR